MEKLFTDNAEYTAFLKFIAARRVKNLIADNERFQAEIEASLTRCGEICSQNGSDVNFNRELLESDERIAEIERKNFGSTDVGDITSKMELLRSKYEQFIERIPLEAREDLEYEYKKVMDRKTRIKSNNDIISQISLEYPDIKTATAEERRSLPIFKKINAFINPQAVELEEQGLTDSEEDTYVVRIGSAPEELVSEYDIPEVKDEEPEGPAIIDTSFFPKDDHLTYKLEGDLTDPHDFVEAETPEIDEMPDAPKAFETEPIEDSEPVKADDSAVTFTLEQGLSLTDLSVALCGDENGWFDIYNANKALIDQRIEEAGISHDEPFENNDEVFAGLTLVIPNEYSKTSEPKTLAA